MRALNEIAKRRGQSLAQLALSWALRDARVSSVLIGASRPEQIADNVAAMQGAPLSAQDLADIDQFAIDGGVNLWQRSSTDFK